MSEHKHTHYTRTKHLSKSAQLAADIKAGKVKYLHVSVAVQAPTRLSGAMRTPRGQGRTARKTGAPQVRVGKARRNRLTYLRLAREEMALGT